MVSNQFQRLRLLILVVAVLVSIVLLVGVGEGGATADFQPQSATVPDGWTAECVDCMRYFSGMSGNSAALDSGGLVHTAYGGDALYYAVQNPDDTYTTEVVDANPKRGLDATMVLDSNDRPHIVYYAGDLLKLNYAYFDGANWQISTLPTSSLSSLPHPWLVIDSSDNLHIAFTVNFSILYGVYDGNSWSWSTVDVIPIAGVGRPSLVLDSSERPHIAYGRGGKYAYFDGLNWQITSFAGSYDQGDSIAIALDQNDYPHFVYQTEFNGYQGLDFRYRFYDGAGWQTEDVEEADISIIVEAGYDASIFIDAAGQPTVVFTVQFSSGTPYPWFEFYVPRLARREQNGWQIENLYNDLVPFSFYDSTYTTMMSGPGSDLTFVYKRSNALYSAVLSNDLLTETIIDQGGDTGTYIDMAVDSEDRLHISAHEGEIPRLRYALKEQGSWSVETPFVGAGFEGSPWTSMALTTDDRPFIMFDHYDRPGGLPFIYFDGQDWVYNQNLFWDNYNFDVAMDGENDFHVAFIKWASFDIHLAHMVRHPSGAWEEDVAIDEEVVEGQLDIAIDSAGFPHIAYPAIDGLRYAVETPSGWVTETVAAGDVDYPSLALDRFGRPHIAWYEKSTADLMYAAYDGTTWQIETVDGEGDMGQYASLAVDRIGRVFIAYYDATNGDLKYAMYDDGSWTVETLLSEGDVGSYSKLAMPYAGYPAIAYYDATARDLMVVYRPFLPDTTTYLPVLTRN